MGTLTSGEGFRFRELLSTIGILLETESKNEHYHARGGHTVFVMVKSESQARTSNYRSHSPERTLTPEAEAHTNGMLSSPDPSVIKYQPTQKSLSPDEIEQAFLNYYSNFVGADLSEKTTWKSENFSQNQGNLASDRTVPPSDPSKRAHIPFALLTIAGFQHHKDHEP